MKDIIEDIKDILNNLGGSAYIVGGYIRDKLIGCNKVPEDLDIIYDGNIHVFIEKLIEKGYNIFPIKEDMKIYRGIFHGSTLDISELKGNNIEEDLQNRDFTLNAIALKLIDNKIIDPFKGRDHIKARIIHEVNESSIKDDSIRILRAYRFAIKYGMHFSKECENSIIKSGKYIKDCPKERIFNELIKIIEDDVQGVLFRELDRYGVLKELLPYIEELKIIGKCRYHIEDAFTHMNLVYENFKELLKGNLSIKGLDISIFDENLANISIKNYIAFAAFCHDIGKAKCYKKIDDKISFIGHDKEGAVIVRNVCNELGFPKRGQELIEKLVEAHMYPLGLCKNNVKNYKKSFYKFFSRYDKYIPYILALSYCDMYATKMLYDPDGEENIFKEYIEKLLEEYKIYRKVKDNRLLDGEKVIEVTKAQGKDIKLVLEELDKKIYFGDISNVEEAIKYLQSKCVT